MAYVSLSTAHLILNAFCMFTMNKLGYRRVIKQKGPKYLVPCPNNRRRMVGQDKFSFANVVIAACNACS